MSALDGIVIGGVAINGMLVLIIGFFVQRWMNRVESDRKDDRESVEHMSTDIKERIEANRTFYAQSYSDIKCSIDKLTDKVGAQNGRIGKLETNLESQIKVCEERNKKKKR